MRHCQGLGIAQIGEHLGRSPATVAGLLKRGLARLPGISFPRTRSEPTMSQPSDRGLSEGGGRFDETIAAYLAAEDAGTPPDRDALLAEHPELPRRNCGHSSESTTASAA